LAPRSSKVEEIELLAREIGLFVARLEPSPELFDLATIYGAAFSGLCRELGLNRDRMLQHLDQHCHMTMTPRTDVEDQVRKEGH